MLKKDSRNKIILIMNRKEYSAVVICNGAMFFLAKLLNRFSSVDKGCTFVDPLKQKNPYCFYPGLECIIQLQNQPQSGFSISEILR